MHFSKDRREASSRLKWFKWKWRIWRAQHHAYMIWQNYELWKAPLDYERWQRAVQHVEEMKLAGP